MENNKLNKEDIYKSESMKQLLEMIQSGETTLEEVDKMITEEIATFNEKAESLKPFLSKLKEVTQDVEQENSLAYSYDFEPYEKEIEFTEYTYNKIRKEIEIEFPIYVKRSYPGYAGDVYIKYDEDEQGVKSATAIEVPKNPQDKYSMSYYGIEPKNESFSEEGYKYALSNSKDKDYYEICSKEDYLSALELYKTNFLNKI